MLDNIVTEKCMATMPIEILADAKHKNNNNKHNKYSEDNKDKLNKTNQNQIKTTTTTIAALPVTKTNKTKTLLNWLKNSNNNNNSLKKVDKIKQESASTVTNNNSSTTTTTTTNCTCPSSNLTHSTNSISFFRNLKSNKDDDTLREFRGVQTLRNFWNKRITANKETALRNKSSKQQHFTKSVSCLVNAINNTGEPPPGSTAISTDNELVTIHKLRALSLHDCSRDSPEFDEISLSDIDIQKHLEKDNFYKYKTAEQASKLRELSEHSTHRKLSSGIVLTAGHKGERFDWLKRHEKLINKKTVDSRTNSLTMPYSDNDNTQLITSAKIIDIDSKMHTHSDDASAMPTPVGYGNTEVGKIASSANITTTTSTVTENNSSQYTISRRRPTTRQDSAKTLTSCSSSISRGSSNTSLANSSPANGHRSLVKRNSSTRKYSFKTHTRSYHVPRKMHSNKDTANVNAACAVKPGNSLVAKLTQQFNEIIQKDKTLLEEIKRKNGVLMTHKGHVYKVVDTAALNRSQSPSVSRNTSKVKDSAPVSTSINRSTPSSTVQRNIKKFETESQGLKPKVPLKSVHVLKKSNELVLNKTQANNNRLISISSGNNKKDVDVKPEQKPQTLALPSTLEIVKEEAKTPLETTEENKILTDSPQNYKENQNPHNTEAIKTNENSKEENILPVQDALKENLKPNESVIYRTIKMSQRKDGDIPRKAIEEQAIPIGTSEEIKISLPLVTEKVGGENSEELKEKTEITDKEMKTKTLNCEETQEKPGPKDKIVDKEKVALGVEREINEEADKQTQTLKPLSNLREEKECNAIQCPEPLATPDSCVESLDGAEEVEVEEEDEKRKRKHKYAKIYEKLRFFTPFAHSNKKQKLSATGPTPTIDTTSKESTNITNTTTAAKDTNSSEPLIEESTMKPGEDTSMSSSTLQNELTYADEAYSFIFNPEAKLLDALEQVDKKLQNLSQESEELKPCSATLESDEYGQALKPNSSFLHTTYEKETQQKATTATVIQAVNVSLVNNIEGEQMIMEQKEIQQQEKETKTEEETRTTPELPPRKIIQEEPLYEPICIDNKTLEPKTETSYKNCELKTTIDDLTFKRGHIIEEEDIYQTVEEAKNQNQTCEGVTNNSQNELDGYEPIENPDEILLTLKSDYSKMSSKLATFDGYEEYTPNVELANATTITTSTTTSPAVRKVTDELPDLPKPKRVLPKSPIPLRPAPKPPLSQRQISAEEYRESPCQEPHYYGDEENIYDTIKSSHCYESLQSMSNKLHSSPSLLRHKNPSDCVSLTSNCYESISHFKRTNNVGHHSGGSSNGSTLTISSENKTNSLYEDSLNSSLHYASRRIYQLNVHATNGVLKSASAGNSSINGMNGYGGSIGRTTDTSDEWTDVTDNESGDGESKPQFIIVRERSKAHKSPDWSRRVRDKRQRKSKSCIEDDDPDHYYEQLSPQALSKRHSLLDPSRTGSLQRNQDAVRVSKRGKKMSYSAHALGQHISDDSFDSDTDDYYESEHFKYAHNDSGVDIRTTKLPEPPTSSNQMYSFVKKFKNFIVNKKSPNSSKHGGSQQKIYDSSSQFYGSTQQQYESKTQPLPPTPPASALQVPETKELSTSENNLIMAQTVASKPDAISVNNETRKSKSAKSLRSRIRKSLVGFDNKQLSTLTPTRSTFYIEDPGQDDHNGQLDSGFSEKALSGELPTTTPTPATEAQKFSTIARKAKKEAKLANSQRRRTTIGIRPHEPPPPPPPENNAKSKRQSNTSWYAECGVFKNGTTNLVNDDTQILNGQNGSGGSSIIAGSTWYEEAGLYQTSGVSVASSSGSSGVSTSNEAGPADEMSHSMFSNEPLYQIYSAAKLQAMSRDMQDGGSSTDGYEEIGERQKNSNNSESVRKSTRPSALQLVEPKSGPERTLWSHIPEVINSYIIPTLTARERALMEAKFEIITSEASYLKSLNLLRTHYMNHPVFRDQNVVSSRDRKFLFAHIVPVHECSEKLLSELESCWQDNIMLIGLSKRIYAIAEKHFHVYVGFCEHQGRMDRTLKRLREAKGLFAQNLELLESSPACCGLTLHSFLMLPMQRITRLPLLIDAVFSKCHHNDDEYENWKMCLAIMNKIVTQCNEAANKSEQAFEIERISRQLEFNPTVIRPLAIAPAGILAPGTKPRYLVKKGELTHLIWRGDDAKLTFGKKFTKTTIFAFLFSDLLVLTKRKAEEQFSVFDYCPRNMLTITSGDTLPQLPTKDLNSQTSKNLILMTLLENHERKTIELLLSCPSVSEQQRWLQAMRPPESETPGEKLYEQWDCPQVIATHTYENNEPDVLNLEVGDVVNVTRKLPDGWYQGERIRDGAIGWFPGSYTEEVNSVHVRARNLKQRHRLLTFTATYLESQKRSK